ncbi:VirK/YbjX family protein [Leclercia adecarboxylata]|uniref:VirK/YbjX family protein n=1 Tax=Leclercia adecarboxylata TaxID=83655 RepID=UPI001E45842C|nr:VirK/YbjX family protein [Leclercia adecarboxylata]MCE9978929.1 VirK/YbjX family protein [Leclercia adecarboxylata]MCH2680376.1 VirK/YbjX family protein [Leclercia adecarboxylata]MDK4746797.1 VirK/YbjX family protein [Leclercia adecarboxylata]MDU6818143.1 VirK/YbjX family protein [Leclercia adecarboxylata]UFM67924.1 VirK/YbjX family protein [Leclercia adecarboxylata]
MSNTILPVEVSYAHRSSVILALAKGDLTPGPLWQKRDYRLKFFLRTLLFWSSTTRMLETISRRDDFSTLLKAQPTLPVKTQRQYLTRGMTASERAEAILHHYAWIDALPDSGLAHLFTSPSPLPLLQFATKEEASYTIYATSAVKAEREGETTLWLRAGDNTLLASLTFSVIRENDRSVLVIGGLQGPRRDVGRETIKNATRACYGLFPKRILLEAVFNLAKQSGISALYGVSDEGHVFRALRYRLSKGRHLHASYDEFWASLGGKPDNAFRWVLPFGMERKSLESIASKKRAEYRRRFQLLDEIEHAIDAHFCR